MTLKFVYIFIVYPQQCIHTKTKLISDRLASDGYQKKMKQS